jgi:hypothetical protein
MSKQPEFDLQTAHKYFSTDCFNKTWEFIDSPNRTPAEDRTMLHTAMASLWHWSQRADAQPQNLPVGHWQVSRVFALLGQARNARAYAEISLQLAEGFAPFYVAFAYEALARAEMVAGDKARMKEHLEKAYALAGQVTYEEDKQDLLNDLGSIK